MVRKKQHKILYLGPQNNNIQTNNIFIYKEYYGHQYSNE